MFFIRGLMLFLYVLIPTISTTMEKCENINCECFQDEGGLEYHCPSSDWHRKLVVQKQTNQKIRWSCLNVDDMDKYLPNLKLYAEEIRIYDCPLTFEAALNIDFENIENLKLQNCNITAGFVEVVSNFTTHHIEKLILSSVNFEEDLDLGNFSGTNLHTLELTEVDINYGIRLFQDQSNLNILNLRSNHIKLLKENTFENLVKLVSLDLSDNDLVYLHSDTFKGLSDLTHLFLMQNHIEFLEKPIFRDLIKLSTLDLSHNNICLLHRDILKPLKSLREINLDNNEGLELDDYLFSNFPELRKVTMRSCNLKKLPGNIFSGSPKISRIDLQKNSISSLPNYLFDGLTNLETLILTDNELLSIHSSAFNSLSGLKKLDLSNNKLQRLEAGLFEPLVKLEYLDARFNKINYIGNRCFYRKEYLREIYLSYNEYKYDGKSGSKDSFADCPQLEILDLSSNRIETIPQELLDTPNSLKSLDLQGNKMKTLNLTSVWKTAYKGIMINLEDNKITRFIFDMSFLPEEPEDPDKNEHASYIFLAKNPLNCDCSAKKFLDFVNNVMERSPDWGILFVFKDLTCASPKNLKGIEFMQISRHISGCKYKWNMNQMASCYTIVLLTYIICAMVCESALRCMDTDCFCEDYGPILYQCPKGKKTEIEIRVEKNRDTIMSCRDKQRPENFLPKNFNSTERLTIENCIVSSVTANTLKITNTEILNFHDSIFSKDFVGFLFEALFPRLQSSTLDAVDLQIESSGSINAPKLTYLELRNLGYNSVLKLVNNQNKLEVLNLKKIDIISLDGEIFKKLPNLLELQIDLNSIEKIDDQAFRSLESLRVLNLGNNNIKFIRSQVLRPLQFVRQIILDNNDGLSLDNYLFANFSHLSIIHIRNSGLISIPENIFSGSSNISEISLQSNYITNIPEKLLDGLKNLMYVDLNDNKLKTLEGVFRNLPNLQKLELNYNEIPSIGSKDFWGLGKLRELGLSHNEIGVIEEAAFETNEFLEEIRLSHNRYKYEAVPGMLYTDSPFSKCKNLKVLDLSYNLMKDIPDDLPVLLSFLEYLNLEGNNIEILDLEHIHTWNDAFKYIKINLQNNNISHFPKNEMIDPDYEIEETPTELEHIHLLISGNPLNCDCHAEHLADLIKTESRIFQDIEQLKCFDPPNMKTRRFIEVSPKDLTCELLLENEDFPCTDSPNCTCHWRPFDKTLIVNCSSSKMTMAPVLNVTDDMMYQKLEVHLEDNLLTEFSELEGYENVTSLFLSKNHMRNVSWIPSKIEVIDISHNNLTVLTKSILNALSSDDVKNVTMGNNSWLCDCDNYHMNNFVVGNIKKIDAENIRCASSQTTIYSVAKKDICTDTNLFLIAKIAIFILPLIAFLTSAVFYYKYQQEIKVWLYAKNLCVGFLEEEDLDKHKKFDVFLSFSHKDADFVENHLVPLMEDNPFNYKLCLHYRDWTPGSFITENIANSVASSKRTLIVLSPNFVESIWGKMEFRMAHLEAMKEKRNRVILLMKGDVNTDELDEELKLYVSTNTYIKWGDPWFWKKLRYALPRVKERECESIQIAA
ncbi:toll-like receptor 6 [Coccinella septempunctata]|uniref:toll-like receptor 6 n=1 Tax=Coccinella septempunctata TaxID=41139 RepID=UPI001D065A15|nr:toll-like receptor 6 [Coccinella septempunctata]